MVLAGEGDNKISADLQALLWGYMDDSFKKGDNPLKDYKGSLEFVKPIWGEMEGERWKNFEDVTLRLNLPELIDYYTKEKFTYRLYFDGHGTAKEAFRKKVGINCDRYEKFIRYCLMKSGYKAKRRDVVSKLGGPDNWHVITEFIKKNKKYIIDNGTFSPTGIIGPLKSLKEAGYSLYF